ncbi:putative mitochondrial hypothetical protein [Leptomonas pyrrhocoris]|uniref:Uncharacterized protein n=1 Tax=Leptomonas pyrrhocoris TaxID=157538 RepID=A0A0N0VFA5_LEPPY|nr:putative mitochondrial hypothetical protein [Leptomonas pyrrhocoris]KPA80594.1 putative mitochondrial hypothetical protein [Leptomonas pyrrhocoris]|eukprot:XP_015659033.1 putative mitochondrial hypothetical protein [Leptomonas pyrrhocoris]
MWRTFALLKPANRKEPNIGRLLYGKRKNAVLHVSEAKPGVTTVLAQTPTEKLSAAVKHALRVNELGRDEVVSLLKQHRALRRLDRTEVLVQTLREAQQPLTAQHYCILMAHANDERQTRKALQFWKAAVAEGKVNERLHGALLSTYRNAGNWKAAMQHCEGLWADQQVLDPLAVHAVMNACRRYGPWQAGLKVFSSAVQSGTKPNGVVYLELLRLVAQSTMPGRWSYSLAILNALDAKVELTAGHYNAVLSTMGGRNWEKGIQLFHAMQQRSIQPSGETLSVVQQLNPHSVSHCIRCVADAHALGMPVTDTMYRSVLLNLFRMQLNHEATQFAEREYGLDRADAGNPVSHTLALSIALVDALLAHPRPHDALLVYESFQDRIGDVVGAATRQLGTTGSLDQRWLVQGRVAVVDHNVLLSSSFESLIHHYDSIFIPFAAVRLLARRARDNGDSVQGRYMKTVLRRIGLLLRREEWRMLRVLPFAHQLLALTYLSEGGPSSPDALRALRAEAEKHDLLDAPAAMETAPRKESQLLSSASSSSPSGRASAYGKALLDRLTPAGEEGLDLRNMGDNAVVGGFGADMMIRSEGRAEGANLVVAKATAGGAADALAAAAAAATSQRTTSPSSASQPSVFVSSQRVTSVERVTAVAAMLKSLNPDAEVHVLSSNPSQLASVYHWNEVRAGVPLVGVHYPEQLTELAPPATPLSSEKGSNSAASKRKPS